MCGPTNHVPGASVVVVGTAASAMQQAARELAAQFWGGAGAVRFWYARGKH
ncbi:MAG: M81 family metallopeptidase [Chloroflexaceae bacterium]|nr:M81 family metallopeptidase [Chloroflexaceae bacterium]